MINKYYILEVKKADLPELVSKMTSEVRGMFVQQVDTIRWNLDKTKCVVKLVNGVDKIPDVIAHLSGYNHVEIKIALSTSEWVSITP